MAAFPSAFAAKALVKRLPISVHTAILDAVVAVGGAMMIAGGVAVTRGALRTTRRRQIVYKGEDTSGRKQTRVVTP